MSTRPTYVSASEPFDEEGRIYHLQCKRGDMAPYVLLPGDPARVYKISELWDRAEEVAKNREFIVHTGEISGAPVSAVSTGIGNSAMATVIESLARIGVDTFIRVGTCGAIKPGVQCGDLIISTGAVRLDGASKAYVRAEYPAFAHYEVLLALIEAVEELGCTYHLGITASTDSWYCGQGRPGFGGYQPSFVNSLIPDLQAAGVINFEMESSALLTLANLFGFRAGAIYTVYANRVEDIFEKKGLDELVRAANEAVKILHEIDGEKKKAGKERWFRRLG